MKVYYSIVLSICLILTIFESDAQDGPAGVGTVLTNSKLKIWLKADALSLSDQSPVSSWGNLTNFGGNATQSNSTKQPLWFAEGIHGNPVLRFDGINDDLVFTSAKVTDVFGSNMPNGGAIFLVCNYENAGTHQYPIQFSSSGTSASNLTLMFDSDFYDDSHHFSPNAFSAILKPHTALGKNWNDVNKANSVSYHTNYITELNLQDSYNGTQADHQGLMSLVLNGVTQNTENYYAGNFGNHGNADLNIGANGSGGARFKGDIAEIIVFGSEINTVETHLIRNYLATKYGISLGAHTYFTKEDGYINEIVGIGKEADGQVLNAKSDLLEITTNQLADQGDYMMIGHNNADKTTLTTHQIPDKDNIQRIARTWQLSNTGNTDAITCNFELSGLSLPAGYTDFVLIESPTTNFSSTNQISLLTPTNAGNYSITKSFSDGDTYLTIGAIKKTITFTQAEETTFEDTDASFDISLNFIPSENFSIAYKTSATGTNDASVTDDYLSTQQTITFVANDATLKKNIAISVIDDLLAENTEYFDLELFNLNVPPSLGTIAFTQNKITYPINDNDNDRKIYFDSPTSSVDENAGIVEIPVYLSPFQTSTIPTTVKYKILGGTATEGVDYELLDINNTVITGGGTLTIPANFVASTIRLRILNGGSDPIEGLQTIELELYEPTNANLETDITKLRHTLRIQEEENIPQISFVEANVSRSESLGSYQVELTLDKILDTDIQVDLSIDEAYTDAVEGEGNDFTLAQKSLTIPAYTSSIFFELTIFNELIPEVNEGIRLNLSNFVNAKAGNQTSFTYTIENDDEIGHTGPAGVGKKETNSLWLRADQITANTHTSVNTWHDVSGNERNVTGSGHAPQYLTDGGTEFNHQPIVQFAQGDYLEGVSTPQLFGKGSATAFLVFKDGGTQNTRQYLMQFPKNNVGRSFLTLAIDGQWNDANSNWGTNHDGAITSILNTNLQSGFTGVAIEGRDTGFSLNNTQAYLSTYGYYNSLNQGAGEMFLKIDGTSLGTVTGYGLYDEAETAPMYIGRYAGGGSEFDGDIAEVILYNVPLNQTQIRLVENYLAEKYQLTISNDIYTQANFSYDVAGIGQINPQDQHTSAQSSIITISDPSDLGNGEFLLWGSNNASISQWDDLGNGNVATQMKWKVAHTGGNVGTVHFSLDASQLNLSDPILPSQTFFLMVDTDADDTFELAEVSENHRYPLIQDGTTYRAEGVELPDNAVFTIVSQRPFVSFSTNNLTVNEDIGTIEVSLNISSQIASDVNLTFSPITGTANAGSDFSITSTPTMIAGNTNTAKFIIEITNDLDLESVESLQLTLESVGVEAQIGSQNSINILIADNDHHGYVGPAGIGDASTNILWFSADQLPTSLNSGTEINTWEDRSGNAHHASKQSNRNAPTYLTNALNGMPAVHFDDTNNEFLQGNLTGANIVGSQASTVYVVAKRNTGNNQSDAGLFLGNGNGSGFQVRHYGLENKATVRFNNGNRIFTDGFQSGTWTIGTWMNQTGANYGTHEFYLNGATSISTEESSSNSARVPNTTVDRFYLGVGENSSGNTPDGYSRFLKGEMAEVIVFNTYLNLAQRTIIENYLGVKYNLVLEEGVKYTHQNTHAHDLAGIGQAIDGSQHLTAQSANILKFSKNTDFLALSNNEYLMFAHNGGANTWQENTGDLGSTQVLNRSWRISTTGSDQALGALEIAINTTDLPTLPNANYTAYGIWVDDNDDLTDGANWYPLTKENNTAYWKASLSSIPNDAIIKIGILAPSITLTTESHLQETEEEKNRSLELRLNHPVGFDMAVNVDIEEGNGIAATDYELITTLPITIPKGTTQATLDFKLKEDLIEEADEKIRFTLTSVEENLATIGTPHSTLLTINDDDKTVALDFSVATATASEEDIYQSVLVRLRSAEIPYEPSSANVSVKYRVIGGTAISGVDYEAIPEGTLNFVAGEASAQSILVQLIDDQVQEEDETILLELFDINGDANLKGNKVITFVIQDLVDTPPEVNFTTATLSRLEKDGTINLPISLSQISGYDITITVDQTGGSATKDNGNRVAETGEDYFFNTNTYTLPKGTQTLSIPLTLINDTDIEAVENIEFQITAVNANATIGTNASMNLVIYDDDNLGYTGPAGVGDKEINKLWFTADRLIHPTNLLPRNHGAVEFWENISGNENMDAISSEVAHHPEYITNALNGHPVVRFDQENNEYLQGNFTGLSGAQANTVFIVANKTSNSNEDDTGLFLGNGNGSGGSIRMYGIEEEASIRFNNGNRIFVDGFTPNTWTLATWTAQDGASYGEQDFYLNGALVPSTQSSATNTDATHQIPNLNVDRFYLGVGENGSGEIPEGYNRYLEGDIAEVILYNTQLNLTQRTLVENYLASKYELLIPAQKKKYHHSTYHYDVAGIGKESNQDFHLACQSNQIIALSNPTDLDESEYLMIGHNNASMAWQAQTIDDFELYYIPKTWRVDQTGDVGNLNIEIQRSELHATTDLGFANPEYVLLVDQDGDLRSGVTFYPLETNATTLKANAVALPSGAYVNIAVFDPQISFVNTIENRLENQGNTQVEIRLNFPLSRAVNVSFRGKEATTSPATLGTDYNLNNGDIRIEKGTNNAYIDLEILQDYELEKDEELIIELTATDYGTLIHNVQTLSINDDDIPRKISFQQTETTINESVGTLNLAVQMDVASTEEDIIVNYKIKPTSTATALVDFSLPQTGQLIFEKTLAPHSDGSVTKNLTFDIHNDLIDEIDERIEIELIGVESKYANLGTQVVHTYTIIDDDLQPHISFSQASSSGSEYLQTLALEVRLSSVSEKNLSIDYAIQKGAGTATENIDFATASGNLNFPAGEISKTIMLTIIDDQEVEGGENLEIVLSNPVNTTLGTHTTHHYTILDNDGAGSEGAGGIGDLDKQVVVWLRSDIDVGIENGSKVTEWKDQASVDNSARQSENTKRPTYYDETQLWNNKPNIKFENGTDQVLLIDPSDEINTGGPYDRKTIQIAFRTNANIQERQMLYEEGGTIRGINIYIYDGKLYYNGYNLRDDDNGATTPWPKDGSNSIYVAKEIQINTPYIATLEFDFVAQGENTFIGKVSGYLNGESVGTLNGAGRLFNHPNAIGVGGENGGTVYHDIKSSNNAKNTFDGRIGELLVNNYNYNLAQRTIADNYFANKYGIVINENNNDYDKYSYDDVYNWGLIGIGQESPSNSHADAWGRTLLRISNPDQMNDGEYLLLAHDHGDKELWEDYTQVSIPQNSTHIKRIRRVWRADETGGDLGNVRFEVDIDQLTIGEALENYAILVDTDGDFSDTPAEQIYLLSEDHTTYINVAKGDYLTIATLSPEVTFSEATFTEIEDNGTDTGTSIPVEIRLNAPATQTMQVSYKTVALTNEATEDTDYTQNNGTLTFNAGEIRKTITQTYIYDELANEGSEEFKLILENPTNGLRLGTHAEALFTIQDNDENVNAQFTSTSQTIVENIGAGQIEIPVTVDQAVNASVNVNFSIDGINHPLQENQDYRILSPNNGLLNFTADGATTQSIVLEIIDNAIFEKEESLKITLSDPTGVNLGANQDFTLTVQDNDSQPILRFTQAQYVGLESLSPTKIVLGLFDAVGNPFNAVEDMTVRWAVTSNSTADNNGIDYFTQNNPSVTIPKGSNQALLEIIIYNDDIIDDATGQNIPELIEVELQNIITGTATIDQSNKVVVYSIMDDEGIGTDGPGGVSKQKDQNGDGEYFQWLKPKVGLNATLWADQSGYAYDLPIGTAIPANDFSYLSFNGNQQAKMPRITNLNRLRFNEKTFVLALQADDLSNIANKRQVIYEQGGGTRGFNIFIDLNGHLKAHAYENSSTPYEIDLGLITEGEKYGLIIEYYNNTLAGEVDVFRAWLNGNEVVGVNAVDGLVTIQEHSDVSFGGIDGKTRIKTGTNTSTVFSEDTDPLAFHGKIFEFAHYNSQLTSVDIKIINNYLMEQYHTDIHDVFTHGNLGRYDVFGIGRGATDNDFINIQTRSMDSEDFVTLTALNELNKDEYVLIGHNQGDINTWKTHDINYFQTINRLWEIGGSTNVQNLQLAINTSKGLAPLEENKSYFLIIHPNRNNAGFSNINASFLSNSQIIPLNIREGEHWISQGLTLNQGAVFTIASGYNITVKDGDWNDPTVWITQQVPKDNESAIVLHQVTVEESTAIGEVKIEENGMLDLQGRQFTITEGGLSQTNIGQFKANGGTVVYNSSQTQSISAIPYENLILRGGTKTYSHPLIINGNLTVEAEVTPLANEVIELKKDLIVRNHNFMPHELAFTGTNLQQIITHSNSQVSPNILHVNTSGHIRLRSNMPLRVMQALILEKGIVFTDTDQDGDGFSDSALEVFNNALIYNKKGGKQGVEEILNPSNFPSSTVAPSYFEDASFVQGPLRIFTENAGDHKLMFPVGVNGKSRKVILHLNQGLQANTYYQVEAFSEKPHEKSSLGIPGVNINSLNEVTWEIKASTNALFNHGYVDFYIRNDDKMPNTKDPFNNSENAIGLQLYKTKNGAWSELTIDQTNTDLNDDDGSGYREGYVRMSASNTFNSFSLYGFFIENEIEDEVLPIELIYFNASINDLEQVVIDWTTASEIGSSFFDIQRSIDGLNYQSIAHIEASEHSEHLKNYQFIDQEPHHGVSYYRLVERDMHGKAHYFKPERVHLNLEKDELYLEALPNPVSSEQMLVVSFKHFSKYGNPLLSLYNSIGTKVYSQEVGFHMDNGFSQKLTLPSHLPSGMYTLSLNFEGEYYTKKIIID